MDQKTYRIQRDKLLSLLDLLREGHSLETSLSTVFPNAPNPIVASISKCKEEIKARFQDSPLRLGLNFILTGVKHNRKKTIQLTEDLIEVLERNYRVQQRERGFRKSLVFKSYIVSAATASSLGVISLLTIFGFFYSSMQIGGVRTLTIFDLLSIFMTLLASLFISLFTMTEAVAKNRKEKISIFGIGFGSFTIATIISYLIMLTL